jgi:hypothetical protein
MTSKSVKDILSKKNPTKAHLGNKPSELSFILACKVEIFEPSVRIYCTPSPLRYALTIKDLVGSGTTM